MDGDNPKFIQDGLIRVYIYIYTQCMYLCTSNMCAVYVYIHNQLGI